MPSHRLACKLTHRQNSASPFWPHPPASFKDRHSVSRLSLSLTLSPLEEFAASYSYRFLSKFHALIPFFSLPLRLAVVIPKNTFFFQQTAYSSAHFHSTPSRESLSGKGFFFFFFFFLCTLTTNFLHQRRVEIMLRHTYMHSDRKNCTPVICQPTVLGVEGG